MAPSSSTAPRHAGLARFVEPARQLALRACGVAGIPQIDPITDTIAFCWTPGSNNPNSVLLIDRNTSSLAVTDPGTYGLLAVSREKNELMERFCRERRLDPRWCLLTHKHADHIGNGVFRDRLETVYAHESAFGHLLDPGSWVEDMIRLAQEGRGAFKNNPVLKALSDIPGAARPSWFAWRSVVYGRGYEPLLRKENRGLLSAYPKNGRLLLGGLDMDVYETPGHCPDEVALRVFSGGKMILIVGDIIRPQRGLPIDAVPSAYAPEGDPYAIVESLQMLLNQEADVILPAHGQPIIGREKVQRVLSANLAKTWEIITCLEHFWRTRPNCTAQQIGNAVFKCRGMRHEKLLGLDEQTAWAASVRRLRPSG